MPGLVVPFMIFTGVYVFLAGVVTWLLVRHIRNVERDYESARAGGDHES
jgi:cytochrome bd-type quinol oxidase subunit 1